MSVRVHELAKELKISSKDLLIRLKELKVGAKGHMSNIDDEIADIVRQDIRKQKQKKHTDAVVKEKKEKAEKKNITVEKKEEIAVDTVQAEVSAEKVPTLEGELKILELDLPINAKQLAEKLDVRSNMLIQDLMKRGIFATINQNLDEKIVREIALTHGYEIKKAVTLEEELKKEVVEEEDTYIGHLVHRFPVVTFMGHVDHGKTSLLDYIKKTKVASKEKGGITQHIGAYKVNLPKGSVTFLDTPGHEAFTAMRARGANATDIVVLVVACDDGIMPQTKEAIDHARAANVPIVVAANKCDLPSANLDRIKNQLNEQGLIPEEWGGKTIVVPVSAKTGAGIDNLLEMLLLEAELLELKANPNMRARGVVIEGKLSPGQGIVATLLVKSGTLKVGDIILSGLYYGKIKAMIDERRNRVTDAPPSTPVEVLGLTGMPEAGNEFFVVKDEKKAKTLSLLKQGEKRQKELNKSQRVSLEHLYDQIKRGGIKELKIILKVDVQGSLEALQKSLESLSTEDVILKIIHTGIGNISESDIMLAVVSNAVVIGFHVKIDTNAEEIAKKELIDVKLYDVIYNLIDNIKAGMEGLLEPVLKEISKGKAKVLQVFKVSKIGLIAGCNVLKGTIARSHQVKVVRAGKVLKKSKIKSLKRFKDDVKDVTEGMECGIAVNDFTDIKSGDVIESYVIEKIARRLNK